VGIDCRCGRNARQIADRYDRVTANADIAPIPRRSRTVDDPPVDDLQIEGGGRALLRRTANEEKAEGRKQKAEVGYTVADRSNTSAFCLLPSAFCFS